MWPFKKSIIKKINNAAWGHLVNDHKIDVDTLSKDFRCVERQKKKKGKTLRQLRVFKPVEAEKKGVEVEGWDTFDEHPDLIHFEGYVKMHTNEAYLERKAE